MLGDHNGLTNIALYRDGHHRFESKAAEQLQSKYQFQIALEGKLDVPEKTPYEIIGPYDWTHAIFRAYIKRGTPQVHVTGIDPIVRLSWGSMHIEDEPWNNPEPLIDLISSQKVGPGNFYVIAPLDLFDDSGLRSIYGEEADVVRQQMAELMLRMVKITAGDKTFYAD